MGKLEGKVAVVTGGARGMGAEITKLFVKEGAKVFSVDLLAKEGEAVAKALGKNVKFMQHDVSVSAEWPKIIAEAEKAFGAPIDILVNNAGKFNDMLPFESTTDEMFLGLMHNNACSAFYGIKAVLSSMRKTEKGGSIINIASIGGMSGAILAVDYSVSKWALRGISRSAAASFAWEQIRVNTVLPGTIRTPMLSDQMIEMAGPMTPMQRVGEVDDIANAVLFLASDDSKYITGAELTVDGGNKA